MNLHPSRLGVRGTVACRGRRLLTHSSVAGGGPGAGCARMDCLHSGESNLGNCSPAPDERIDHALVVAPSLRRQRRVCLHSGRRSTRFQVELAYHHKAAGHGKALLTKARLAGLHTCPRHHLGDTRPTQPKHLHADERQVGWGANHGAKTACRKACACLLIQRDRLRCVQREYWEQRACNIEIGEGHMHRDTAKFDCVRILHEELPTGDADIKLSTHV